MANSDDRCPCCGRPLKRIFDYPRVQVLSFERLPVPEAVDDMSEAAAQKPLQQRRANPADANWSRQGINRAGIKGDGNSLLTRIDSRPL